LLTLSLFGTRSESIASRASSLPSNDC